MKKIDKPPVRKGKVQINPLYLTPIVCPPHVDLPWWRAAASARCASPPHAPFFSTCRSTCVAHAACFVCCSIFLTTFLITCSFSFRFNRHLCHGAYWCTHNPAHMSILLFHLHLPFSNSCLCVSKHVCAFTSSSIFIHTYLHVHMFTLRSVMYFYPSFSTLHSPFPPNRTLPTHPGTHHSHPPRHNHTLPVKEQFNVPQILLSESWVHNCGASPNIALVSLTHIPCLFDCMCRVWGARQRGATRWSSAPSGLVHTGQGGRQLG